MIKSYSALANIIHNIINESIGYTVNSIIPHILNLLRQGNYNLYVKTCMKTINFKINVDRCILRIGYFDGNIIMDIHFKNLKTIKIKSEISAKPCNYEAFIGFLLSDGAIKGKNIRMHTTKHWQAVLWILINSLNVFSLRVDSVTVSTKGELRPALNISSPRIFEVTTKSLLLLNNPISWFFYILGDGSVDYRKIEISCSLNYFEKLANKLKALGYKPKLRPEKRLIVLTGNSMRKFSEWIVANVIKCGLNEPLEHLKVSKWLEMKHYAMMR